MKITQETIQAVQNVVHITEVIADFVPLKKRGQNFWACCPFHHENTASFSVSPTKGFYKCFGCGAAGDAITFIQQIKGHTFIEAIHYLAQKYGIAIEFDGKDQSDHDLYLHNAKESLYIVLNMAKTYYEHLLWSHPEGLKLAIPYLQQRGIPDSIAKKFELGYSLNSWDAFYKFATHQGISLELLCSAGLVINNDNKIYDRFRGRLVFPIYNNGGKVVAFGARQITSFDIKSPKYINSPETTVYHKGELLYGLSLAKQKIKESKNCYLVEGYTDVLAFHLTGIEQVVASAGTSLTEAQMNHLRHFTSTLTLVFDGDKAGIEASLRGIDGLLSKGFQLKIVLLPIGEDPASYVYKVGASAFMDYMQQHTQDFITFKAERLLSQMVDPTPIQQANAIRNIIETITHIPDEIERHFFLKKCSQLFSVREEIIWNSYHQITNKLSPPQTKLCKPYNQNNPTSNPYRDRKQIPFKSKLTYSIEAYEREIIRILLTYGNVMVSDHQKLCEYIATELDDISFRSEPCNMLYNYFIASMQEGKIVDLSFCLTHGDASIKKAAIDLTAFPHEISEAWVTKYGIYTATEVHNLHHATLEVILRLKIRLIQELIEENRETLKKEHSIEEEENLLKIHQLLKETESNIAKQLGTVVIQ